MHPKAICRYVVKLIEWAYEQAGDSVPSGMQAHDVRGSTTSLRAITGFALMDVLETGQWFHPDMFTVLPLKISLQAICVCYENFTAWYGLEALVTAGVLLASDPEGVDLECLLFLEPTPPSNNDASTHYISLTEHQFRVLVDVNGRR